MELPIGLRVHVHGFSQSWRFRLGEGIELHTGTYKGSHTLVDALLPWHGQQQQQQQQRQQYTRTMQTYQVFSQNMLSLAWTFGGIIVTESTERRSAVVADELTEYFRPPFCSYTQTRALIDSQSISAVAIQRQYRRRLGARWGPQLFLLRVSFLYTVLRLPSDTVQHFDLSQTFPGRRELRVVTSFNHRLTAPLLLKLLGTCALRAAFSAMSSCGHKYDRVFPSPDPGICLHCFRVQWGVQHSACRLVEFRRILLTHVVQRQQYGRISAVQ